MTGRKKEKEKNNYITLIETLNFAFVLNDSLIILNG